MCKKFVIAALAVVVGLAVVKGTWIGSHLRMQASKARAWAKNQVSPEKEIARLRMELRNLEKDDDQFFDKVARMAVKVENLEKDVAKIKGNLTKEEKGISQLRDNLAGNTEFVSDNGITFTRDDLRSKAMAFQIAEENLKSKQANLQAQKKHLALERQKLTQLRTIREEMATQLQKLETALAEERHAQAASESTIDDSGYRKLKAEMDAVRDRIEVLKKKRELRGEFAPIARDEQTRERDSKADKYLEERFGKVKQDVNR
jgi:peptidoglycan hydrolase CwlO-like protein